MKSIIYLSLFPVQWVHSPLLFQIMTSDARGFAIKIFAKYNNMKICINETILGIERTSCKI